MLALVFFVSGLFALVSVLQNASLLARDLQLAGIAGQTTVPLRTANFDHGTYLRETALGFLNADLLSYATTEAPDEVASEDTFEARVETAVQLLEQSLALDPASGYAWAYYAHALHYKGDVEAARKALAIAWDMAPHQHYIALQRLATLDGIYLLLGFQEEPGSLTEAELAAGLRDLEAVERRISGFPRPDWLDG